MPAAVVVCIMWLTGALVLGAAIAATANRLRQAPRLDALRRRVGASVDAVSAQLGRLTTAVIVVLAGWAAVIVVCWFAGELAQALEGSVDRPMFDWFRSRQLDGGWSQAWGHITNIGAPHITGYVAAVGSVVLAIAWRLRGLRWWLPGVTLWTGIVLVRYAQFILKDVVDRGHPPTTLGTYPSGGCARVVVVYGLLIFFAVLWLRPKGPGLWIAGTALTAFLVSVQGYARTYNLEHWFTDVVGGTLFGILVIAVMISAYRIAERPRSDGAHEQPREDREALEV